MKKSKSKTKEIKQANKEVPLIKDLGTPIYINAPTFKNTLYKYKDGYSTRVTYDSKDPNYNEVVYS